MASVNMESKIGHLYEVKQNLKSAIPNLERVVKEQDSLIKIIEEAENKYDLSDEMIDHLIADKQQIEKNLAEVGEQLVCVDTLLEAFEKEKKENYNHSTLTTEAIVTLLLNGLGLFRTSEADADAADAEAIAEASKDESAGENC